MAMYMDMYHLTNYHCFSQYCNLAKYLRFWNTDDLSFLKYDLIIPN